MIMEAQKFPKKPCAPNSEARRINDEQKVARFADACIFCLLDPDWICGAFRGFMQDDNQPYNTLFQTRRLHDFSGRTSLFPGELQICPFRRVK